MKKLSALYEKILKIVRARSQVGGLDVSDTSLRYAFLKGGTWQFEEVAVPPGALVHGLVQDEPAFVGAVRTLHDRLTKGNKRRRVSAVISLSSATVYSQVFALPRIADKELDKAVALNMQMNSPIALVESSSGWQELGHTNAQTEVLAASLALSVTTPMRRSLEAGGFLPVVLESRSFSIARIVRSWLPGFSPETPYLVVLIDDVGLTVLVLQRGYLYFEYSSFWADIQGDAPNISMEVFDEALSRHVGQVLNFHRQHGGTPFKEALVLAPSLQDHIAESITKNYGLASRAVQLGDPPVQLPWFIAVGSGLRGSMARSQDVEINLLGSGARSAFQEEQVLRYLEFWRALIPVALAVLLGTAVATYAFIGHTRDRLDKQVATLQPGGRITELTTLEREAVAFNALVAQLGTIQTSLRPKSPAAASLYAYATQNGITLARVYLIPAPNVSIVSGFAASEDGVVAFKKQLEKDGQFTEVTLPISAIRSTPQGISFSMTFKSDFSASAKTP